MKYAIINPKGRVLRLSEDEPKFIAEGNEAVSISNEKAKKIDASSEPLFLVEGNLITFKEKLFNDNPEAIKESLRPERKCYGRHYIQINNRNRRIYRYN